jgi:tRNA G10  N-methylase Trm11
LGALSATIASRHQLNATEIYDMLRENASFVNAFEFDPTKRGGLDQKLSLHQAGIYNHSLQFISVAGNCDLQALLTPEIMVNATKRCALVHTLHRVVADGTTYSELIDKSRQAKAFGINDMFHTNKDEKNNEVSFKSWAMFREEYSFGKDLNSPRFGKGSTRSSESKEKAAITALMPLLQEFRGKVNLKDPECPIYLLEGLRDDISIAKGDLYKILCIKLASGAKHSIIAPKTRICKSTTPLCSITSHILCNIAMIHGNQTILDPFAGSASTLLAVSLVAPDASTVGIEVDSDELLSREKIRRDFSLRGLKQPLGVLQGDAMDVYVRDEARELIMNAAFDVIITDPPFGKREKMSRSVSQSDGKSALSNLIEAIEHDRFAGKPLLKRDGRMIAFQPCSNGQNIQELLPTLTQLQKASLILQDKREQRLTGGLSRWVLSFLSV